MLDYQKVLSQNPAGVFATQDGDKVKTRVFQFFALEGNKLYFATSNQKPVYAQMQKNPNVSFCTFAEHYNPVLAVNGKAVFVQDAALKQRAFELMPSLTAVYQNAENPVFEVFYLDIKEVEAFDFANGPVKFSV